MEQTERTERRQGGGGNPRNPLIRDNPRQSAIQTVALQSLCQNAVSQC